MLVKIKLCDAVNKYEPTKSPETLEKWCQEFCTRCEIEEL